MRNNADIIQFPSFSLSPSGIVSYFVDTILWTEAMTDYWLVVFPASTVTITDRQSYDSHLVQRGVRNETSDCVCDDC